MNSSSSRRTAMPTCVHGVGALERFRIGCVRDAAERVEDEPHAQCKHAAAQKDRDDHEKDCAVGHSFSGLSKSDTGVCTPIAKRTNKTLLSATLLSALPGKIVVLAIILTLHLNGKATMPR